MGGVGRLVFTNNIKADGTVISDGSDYVFNALWRRRIASLDDVTTRPPIAIRDAGSRVRGSTGPSIYHGNFLSQLRRGHAAQVLGLRDDPMNI